MSERDLAFENVLSGRSAERRTALIVFPAVVVLALLIGFAAVSISRTSALTSELQRARAQVAEATKAVDERDAQLREARADIAVLSTPGQGAALLAGVKDGGASGVARTHPERHSLAVYAYNLMPPPEGQTYQVVVGDAAGRATMLGALSPDERGAASLLARGVPEGATQVEVALVKGAAPDGPKGAASARPGDAAAPQPAPADRQPVLAGTLPRPGEAGVVAAAPGRGSRLQARSPSRSGR